MALGGQSRLHAGAELRFGPPHLRRQTGRRADGQTGFRAFSARALNVAEIVHDYNYAQVLTLDLLHKGMRLTEGYGSVGSYVAGPFSDFEPTLYDPPLGLGTVADLHDADFVIVCVPAPQLPSGACDTSIVEEVVGVADPRVAIVCHSTIAIGTTERLIAETTKPLVFVPEYAGAADDHPLRDPWSRQFLIYGGYDPAASAVQALYERAYGPGLRHFCVPPTVAEVVKYMDPSSR